MQEKARTGVLCPLEAHEYSGKANAVRFEVVVQASAPLGSDYQRPLCPFQVVNSTSLQSGKEFDL
jgi:hypothetical protein